MPTQQMQQKTNSTLVTHNHTVCCPRLNSIAQPWPLPGCNHSPGTVMFNSSLTTKSLSHFLPGQDDEPHLPFQGAESMFTTTREAINWHIWALLFKVFCYSFTVGEGLGCDPSSQGLQSLGLGVLCRREMPAGPRGQQVQQWELLLPLLAFIQWFCVYNCLIFLSATLWFPRIILSMILY